MVNWGKAAAAATPSKAVDQSQARARAGVRVGSKLAYKPRFCHNLHIKLAQHFNRAANPLAAPAPAAGWWHLAAWPTGQWSPLAAHLAPCIRWLVVHTTRNTRSRSAAFVRYDN